MSEPVRFLDGAEGPNGDLAATLFRSAATLDAEEARQRKAALLGAAAAGAAGVGLAGSKGLLHGVGLMKWLWLSAIGAVVVGSASVPFWWGHRDAADAPLALASADPMNAGTGSATETTQREGPRAGPTEDLASEPPSSGAAPATAAAAAPTAAAVVQAPTSSARSGASPAATAPGSRLAEEVAALRRAREALTGGRAGEALSLLSQYSATFPSGRLAAEAAVLRIDALWAAGQRGEAAQRARRWLASHPKSPYAARLKTIAGDTAP